MVVSIPSATCSPTSLQLRLAMGRCNCRSGGAWKPYFIVPASPVALTRRIRPVFVDRRSVAASSGEGGSSSSEEDEKKWLGGAVAAGVAGMVLFAGVACATVSLSKRSTRRPEPVVAQQEVLLAADGEEYTGEEGYKNYDRVLANEGGGGGVVVLPAPTESDELHDTEDSGGGNDHSVVESGEQPANHGYSGNDAYAREVDAQDKSPLSVKPNASDITQRSSEAIAEIPIDNLNDHENEQHSITDEPQDLETEGKPNLSSHPAAGQFNKPLPASNSASPPSETVLETTILLEDDRTLSSFSGDENLKKTPNILPLEVNDNEYSGIPKSTTHILYDNEQDMLANSEAMGDILDSGPTSHKNIFSSSGIPAPSAVPPALQVPPGNVLVPAVLDQFQGQAFTALQTLKVIEADVQPSDICTRREYARWLVAASGALSRNTQSKVYPAMYIENIGELAFDDIMPNDPDFPSIQGLAEAGLISSKLSSQDLLSSSDEKQGGFLFAPESLLSRQDLVSWKMALEKRQLPEADKKILYQLSGFRDVDRIHPDAWPALVADLSAGDQGIIPLAFGCTRLFQPDKPVSKAQAAVALATGESADIVSEELTRIEAESVADDAVSTHNDLVAQVEREINARFEKALSSEKKKAGAVEKMVAEALHELEKLRSEREESNITLMKERAAIEAEMEVLSRLRREMEEQLESLLCNKAVISHEKERIDKMQKETEVEKQDIYRLQYELEVEKKALSMARAWAEDEAKKAREHAKAIEEARNRWERHGIKVVVDEDLRQESTGALTWQTAGKQVSTDGTVNQAENLVGKLKLMGDQVRGKSKEVIDTIIHMVLSLITLLKEWASEVRREAGDIKDKAVVKADGSVQDLWVTVSGVNSAAREKVWESVKGLQQSTRYLNFAFKKGTKRLVDDCREGAGKLTRKFKSS